MEKLNILQNLDESGYQFAPESIFSEEGSSFYSDSFSLDPADRMAFVRPSMIGIQRFDSRKDSELREAMHDHKFEMERERAIWEFADRHREKALQELRIIASVDNNPSIRWSTLWLIQKVGGNSAIDIISNSLSDEHQEVRDWAQLLLRETTGLKGEVDNRPAKFDQNSKFDQTLPLLISGYARVLVPELGWIQATLSPMWFETIMGRVMACTNEKTFDTDLVIEKRIKNYHPDGSNHYEIFKFKGFTHRLSDVIAEHRYESKTKHTFYPSGKVEEISAEPLDDVVVNIARAAITISRPTSSMDIYAKTREKLSSEKLPSRIVESVRGRYMGVAYVNIERTLSNDMAIGPGEVQLSDHHHPIAGPLTNTYLYGSFKGKLSDLDGDGYTDINTEKCHGTLNGEHDFDLDGKAGLDPFDFFS